MSILMGEVKKGITAYVDTEGNIWQRAKAEREESSRISWDDIHDLCKEKNFYTKGTRDEYTNLAELVFDWENTEQQVTTEMLQIVAEDILEHSETVYSLEAIMFELSRKCVRRFYSIAEH